MTSDDPIWSHFLAGKPYVHREGNTLTLQFSPASIQSQLNIEEPGRLLLGYTRTLLGFLLFVPQPRRMTMIGLGGGSLPTYAYRQFPDARIAVVEINAQVIALRDTFHVPPDDARFTVHCGDGAEFVAAHCHDEDVIIVDGFDVSGQAPSLCTDTFYANCFKALAAGGVMAVNLSENSRQHAGFIKRMQRAFGCSQVLVTPAEACTNKIVFAVKPASSSGDTFSQKNLLGRAAALDRLYPLSFRQIVERMALNHHNPLDD